jgi:hypothetical protein
MKPHTLNNLDNFVLGWYIDTGVCDQLIDYFKNSPNQRKGKVSGIVNTNFKISTDCTLEVNSELYKEYTQLLRNVVGMYQEHYPMSGDIVPDWGLLETVQIQHYQPGEGFIAWHTERAGTQHPVCNRHLVWMTYLNDVTDEGETEFYHQNLKVKPEKGLTLIWPADWTHTHRGVTSPTEDKYVITGWLTFQK